MGDQGPVITQAPRGPGGKGGAQVRHAVVGDEQRRAGHRNALLPQQVQMPAPIVEQATKGRLGGRPSGRRGIEAFAVQRAEHFQRRGGHRLDIQH